MNNKKKKLLVKALKKYINAIEDESIEILDANISYEYSEEEIKILHKSGTRETKVTIELSINGYLPSLLQLLGDRWQISRPRYLSFAKTATHQ